MKDIDRDDFHKRAQELIKARNIFIPHVTKNITIAWDLYQEMLAEEKMAPRLMSDIDGRQPRTILDDLGRLSCLKCDSEMSLREIDKGKYRSQWECLKCGAVRKSKKTVEQWIQKLMKRNLALRKP